MPKSKKCSKKWRIKKLWTEISAQTQSWNQTETKIETNTETDNLSNHYHEHSLKLGKSIQNFVVWIQATHYLGPKPVFLNLFPYAEPFWPRLG